MGRSTRRRVTVSPRAVDHRPWRSANGRPDTGDVGNRRLASLGIVAGGTGMLVGRLLLANGPGSDSFGRDRPIPPPWYDDPDLQLFLGFNLLLLGLAGWHLAKYGTGKLLVIIVIAALTMLVTLFDPADGEPVWSQGHTGDELVGAWLSIASASVVLVAALWSSFRERPAGAKSLAQYVFGGGPGGGYVNEVQQGIVLDEGDVPPDGWWLASDGRWYPPETHSEDSPPKHAG